MTRTDSLDSDDVVRLLASRRRRELLRYLREHPDEAVDLTALVSGVRERCREAGGADAQTEIQVRLHHSDLPKLEDAGVVEYDQAGSRVIYEGHDGVETLLETLATQFG